MQLEQWHYAINNSISDKQKKRLIELRQKLPRNMSSQYSTIVEKT